MVNQDFSDLLSEFNAQSVEYLVVGAHELAAQVTCPALTSFSDSRAIAKLSLQIKAGLWHTTSFDNRISCRNHAPFALEY